MQVLNYELRAGLYRYTYGYIGAGVELSDYSTALYP